jgi:uncharacterized protein YukE
MTTPGIPDRPAFPEDNAAKVREFAELPIIGHKKAIELLNTIKDDLFGVADKVFKIADAWSTNETLGNTLTNLGDVSNGLTPYWQGRAASAFTSFTGTMLPAIRENRTAMQSMGKTLANCAKQVYVTYGNAIESIGTCAGKLAGIDAKLLAGLIPGVAVITLPSAINDILSALDTFVTQVTNFIADGVKQIGDFKENSVGFAVAANQATIFAKPDEIMGDPAEWQKVPSPTG